MKFKKVFRGYDPKEVDKHLTENAGKDQQIRAAQKERIEELLEENRALRKLVHQYQADEQAISKSLIASQNLAHEVKIDADKYSELVLTRAKIFCASWRAYSQTLVASLTDEEVREFNFLQRKIENMIGVYESGEVSGEISGEVSGNVETARDAESQTAQVAAATAIGGYYSNPIERVEKASEQVIDLNELISPKQSLEEICAELGILKK